MQKSEAESSQPAFLKILQLFSVQRSKDDDTHGAHSINKSAHNLCHLAVNNGFLTIYKNNG